MTAQLLANRHSAFWNQETVGEPLLRVRPHTPLRAGGHHGSMIRPFLEGDLVEPERLILEMTLPPEIMDPPFFSAVSVPGVCWTEALVGCPVRMETGGAWAEPYLREAGEIELRLGAGVSELSLSWLERLKSATSEAVETAGGRLPVVPPLMRGPLDMMASALGHEAMVELFVDGPELAMRFLDLCADLFIQMAEEHHRIAPSFFGGSVIFGLWAPGRAVRTQLDNAVLLSPELYQRHAMPSDSRIFAAFETVVIHVHSGCLHIAEQLMAAPHLDAIQVSIDHPGGPLAGEILPTLREILSAKPLIVTGPVSESELEALGSLPPEGLALDLQLLDQTN